MDWTAVSAWISAIGIVLAAVSVWTALTEMRQNHKWNRDKASEETLSRLVLGEFPETLDRLLAEFKWDPITDERSYEQMAGNLVEEDRQELNRVLRRLLRILETVFIHVKHGILNEEVCYDYLASIVPNLYCKALPFIERERAQRGDRRVFENFTDYGARWLKRNDALKDGRVSTG